MYEDRFDTDWRPEEMTREEAVWRAYALGVAAALGDQHPGEYRKLVTATGRSLVEMAYDEGKTEAADMDSDLAASDSDEDELDFPDRETAVWSKLISYREEEGDEIHAGRGRRERDDLPDFLRRIDLDSVDREDLDKLRLPEFLRK
jgi:hypothetical protein